MCRGVELTSRGYIRLHTWDFVIEVQALSAECELSGRVHGTAPPEFPGAVAPDGSWIWHLGELLPGRHEIASGRQGHVTVTPVLERSLPVRLRGQHGTLTISRSPSGDLVVDVVKIND